MTHYITEVPVSTSTGPVEFNVHYEYEGGSLTLNLVLYGREDFTEILSQNTLTYIHSYLLKYVQTSGDLHG